MNVTLYELTLDFSTEGQCLVEIYIQQGKLAMCYMMFLFDTVVSSDGRKASLYFIYVN